MHTYLKDTTGWETEYLRDDLDLSRSVQESSSERTLEKKLEGCSFILLRKLNDHFLAEIEFRERFRDTSILVEAKVIDKKHAKEGEDGLHNLDYYQRMRFMGEGCKRKAAHYAEELKGDIERRYFCSEPQVSTSC